MRELKFRIWVKDEERYYDESDDESYQIIPNGQVVYTSEVYEEDGVFYRDTTNATDNVIIEQYTGLKDKNGKEIYEGDIVEAPIYGVWTTGNSDAIFGDKIWKLSVIWSDAECGFLFKVIGSKNQPNRVYDMLDQRLGAFEVIGNIHENADLLEEKR